MKAPLALLLAEIGGGSVADDGSDLRLIADARDGTEIVLSFPYEQLLALAALAIMGRTDCKRRMRIDPIADCDLIATKMFEFGFDQRNGMPVLIMTLANDGKISFALPGQMAGQMHETLGVILGKSQRSGRTLQ